MFIFLKFEIFSDSLSGAIAESDFPKIAHKVMKLKYISNISNKSYYQNGWYGDCMEILLRVKRFVEILW